MSLGTLECKYCLSVGNVGCCIHGSVVSTKWSLVVYNLVGIEIETNFFQKTLLDAIEINMLELLLGCFKFYVNDMSKSTYK